MPYVSLMVAMEKKVAPIAKPKHQLQKTYLREWRRLRGISQEKAAVELNVSRPLLSQIENAKSPYTQRLLERASEVYGCTPTELLCGPKHSFDFDLLFRVVVSIEESAAKLELSSRVSPQHKAKAIIELYKFGSTNDSRPPTPEQAIEFLSRAQSH
ncbi:helix-turn-helix domain-containing protein [Rhizobium lusitanum]|uniref:Helix-turn-helix domain-containing protein n=1 Tax=Rhizobium lusitanum TaxID=293958 RepID=A0A6L9U9S2_9HYPH|nr:helix-turn-helix transcriptional regulator [Rhizobium lusitanum]NEI71046.1 helix-turn-helix domain-containing protein [Rhizobium lusitanum]